MTELRLPDIRGTDKEQLSQIRSFLYQLIPQLQFALNNAGSGGASEYTMEVISRTGSAQTNTPSFDAAVAFSELKPLIIKSADIVQAYYEKINKRLDGVYVAESDFGVYVEQTRQDISANSTEIKQNFENTQVIIRAERDELNELIDDTNERIDGSDLDIVRLTEALETANRHIGSVEGDCLASRGELYDNIQTVSESVAAVDKLRIAAENALQDSIDNIYVAVSEIEAKIIGVMGYIKSGILYYTSAGIPVYGVEIGQHIDVNGEEVFNKFARFTSEKLSFFDQNGIEVAYISDKKLYIGQAEITISLKVGGFTDYVMPNGDVVTKWEGGK